MATVDVRIQRPFANSEGIYESDVLPLEVWRGLAETICHVAQPGSWISAKGRIASRAYTKDDKQYMNYSFVVERMDVLPVA
jgi:single-strand DNA-binding protein